MFEKYVAAADVAVAFRTMGGECNDFMRFLQLEWESYADEPAKKEKKSEFYHHLRDYMKYKPDIPRDWRKDFSGRDFNDLLV